MSIEINQSGGQIWVNNKRCYWDTNGNLVSEQELLPSEATALNDYVRAHGTER